MGSRSQAWRFSDINHDYEVSLLLFTTMRFFNIADLD